MLAAACGMTACSDDLTLPGGSNGMYQLNEDGSASVPVGLHFPDIASAGTRALAKTPDYEALDLYLFVFEEGRGLSGIVKANINNPMPDEQGLVHFKADLSTTDGETAIHLIAIHQDAVDPFGDVQWGTEEEVIPSLYTVGDVDAYWQRVVLPNGIQTPIRDENGDEIPNTGNLKEEVEKALEAVPMVRNFAQVSVEPKLDASTNFEYEGFVVVNTRDRGYIAPYMPASQTFADFTKVQENKNNYYAYVSGQGYNAERFPAGATLTHPSADLSSDANSDTDGGFVWSQDAKFIYERQFLSTNHTFIIIKGNYQGPNENQKKTNYYKIDLGQQNTTNGLFSYYNLLRNIDYHITLRGVSGPGYASPQAAAAGVAFNNLSADVQTRNMLNISDSQDLMYVNFTTYVVVANEEFEFRFQYRHLMGQDGPRGVVNNELVTYDDETIGIQKGDVIADWGSYDANGDWQSGAIKEITVDDEEWMSIIIRPQEPTGTQRRQTFTIFRGKKTDAEGGGFGLSREIKLISQTPWEFVHMDTYPGLWEDFEEVPWDWSDSAREIGQGIGAPLTLFFELPDGLDEAMFPLQFVIESSKQNIENAYVGNAVVQTGLSTFTEDTYIDENNQVQTNTNKGEQRIQYVKTVQWADYDTSNPENKSASHIVRVRFLTITDLAQDGIGTTTGTGNNQISSSTTRLRLTNPYFVTRDDRFTRSTGTSDPTPLYWNFSQSEWTSVVNLLANANHTRLAGNNVQTVNGLTLTEGAATGNRSMSSGKYVNEEYEEYSYIRLSNYNANATAAGDRFTHTHNYPGDKPRIIRLAIVATDDNNNPITNTNRLSVSVTRNGGTGNITQQSGYPTMEPIATGPFPNALVYQYEVPASVTAVSMTVKLGQNNPVRFYSIDFYPRWDEISTQSEQP